MTAEPKDFGRRFAPSESWIGVTSGRYTVDVTLPGHLISALSEMARQRNCNPRDLIVEAVEIFVAERHRLELRGNIAREDPEEDSQNA